MVIWNTFALDIEQVLQLEVLVALLCVHFEGIGHG